MNMSIEITPYACNAYNANRVKPPNIISQEKAAELGFETRQIGKFDTFELVTPDFVAFDTINCVMEWYVSVHKEIHRDFGYDSEMLRQNLEGLNNVFARHISVLFFGVGEKELTLCHSQSAIRAFERELKMGFIQGINDGLGLDGAKQFAFQRANDELQRLSEIWEQTNECFPAEQFVNHLLNNSKLSIDDVMSLFGAATAVSTMVLALLQNKNEQ
jgi:hypothetical protein